MKGDVIKALVPLVDSFEAAANSIKPETDNEKKITTAYQVSNQLHTLPSQRAGGFESSQCWRP